MSGLLRSPAVTPRSAWRSAWSATGACATSTGTGSPTPPRARGTRHTYSNHGFATLGQIVEDVTGQPLRRLFRDRIFGPLGMTDTDLARFDRIRARLATGYALRTGGPRPVRDCDLVPVGAGAIYSTTADMARYVAALLAGGSGEHGPILKPETVTSMFAPQYQPDPRLPGVGLAFFRHDLGGHLVVGHDGLVPGFTSQMSLAPDDGTGVVAFTNGARGAMAWLGAEVTAILGRILGVPDPVIRADVPHRPEIWADLCGWYSFRGSLRDAQKWFVAGAEVCVRSGQLTLRPVTPVPALARGLPLHPDDPGDPYVFRIDLSSFGIGTCRVVFTRPAGRPPLRSGLQTVEQAAELRQRAVIPAASAACRRPEHRSGAADEMLSVTRYEHAAPAV
jgi:hypothetical protein